LDGEHAVVSAGTLIARAADERDGGFDDEDIEEPTAPGQETQLGAPAAFIAMVPPNQSRRNTVTPNTEVG
jgi:hypothetical protein